MPVYDLKTTQCAGLLSDALTCIEPKNKSWMKPITALLSKGEHHIHIHLIQTKRKKCLTAHALCMGCTEVMISCAASMQVLLAGVAVIYSPQTLAAGLQFYERLLARVQPDQRVGGDAWLAAGTFRT